MTKEQLVLQIHATFRREKPPVVKEKDKSRLLCSPEHEEIYEFLHGMHWTDLTRRSFYQENDELIVSPSATITMIDNLYFSYYLPAFLLISLETNNQMFVTESLLFSLGQRNMKSLSDSERGCLCKYLRFIYTRSPVYYADDIEPLISRFC